MREIYIFFEHPTPATHSTLPPGCTSPPAAACQHQRFVSRRMCGRARLTNCRNPCTGYSHLPPGTLLLSLPLSLLLPPLSRQTTCRTANALFVFQRDASSAAAALQAGCSRGESCRGSIIFYSRRVAAARELRRSHLASDSSSGVSASVEQRLEL